MLQERTLPHLPGTGYNDNGEVFSQRDKLRCD